MRICLVTREYPSLGSHGGIGTYTHNLVKGLAARGHDVTVIARAEEPLEAFSEGGVRVEPIEAPSRWQLPAGNRFVGMTTRALPFAHAAAQRFKALAARAPFDVVEVPEYQGWGLGVAMAARCPVVVRLHTHTALVRRLNDVPLDLDARLIAGMERATIKRGAVVLANSAALAQEARQDFGFDHIGVLPLGIDAERFSPQDAGWLRRKLGLPDEAPIVLYVGRLERRKGVETLIEAFCRARDVHPQATLVMAGFGADTGPGGQGLLAVLQARLHALGAAQHVRFMGHVPYELLPRYYSGCDLFVAPSRYEPFGMIYLEAMACGKAVVGTGVGGVPEIVEHGRTGYLVPPEDPQALAQALRELLQYPSWRERIGQAAREHVHASFSLPIIAAATERHYHDVCPLGPEVRMLGLLGRLDRKLASLLERARRAHLEAQHPSLWLSPDARLEPGILWRLASDARVAVGAGTRLRMACELKADGGAVLLIGRNVHIGPWCTFSALEHLEIGDDCLIAERVSIRDHDHAVTDPGRPYHAQGYVTKPVRLGRNVWLGGGVTIVKGVELGDNCVVGANAVVTRSFPANSLIAGVPARLVRTLGAEAPRAS